MKPKKKHCKGIEIKLKLVKRKGLLTLNELINLGFSQSSISRLTKKNKLVKQCTGIYYHPEANIDYDNLDFTTAFKKFGKASFITGLSALYRYRLIEQVPSQIWIMVDNKVQTNNKLYRLIRTKKLVKIGLVNYKTYRITNLERTLIESLKFSGKIGLRTALDAIKKAIISRQTNIKLLAQMAKKLNYTSILNKYLELISEVLDNA